MRTAARLALALMLPASSALAAAPAGAGLGTLFYSPDERLAITQSRSGENTAETASGLALGGLVKRADGKGTVWVNGKAIPEGSPIPPAPAPAIRNDGVVIDGAKVRVGETLNPRTGERADFIAPGAVSASGKKK